MQTDHTVVNQKEELNEEVFNESFEDGQDEQLELFIDIILEANWEKITSQDLLSSQTELAKQLKSKTAKFIQKPKKDFQLHGLILEKMKVYDGLDDSNLQEFLSKKNRRQILTKTGLLNEEGFIVNLASSHFFKNRELKKNNLSLTNTKNIENKAGKLSDKQKVSPYYNKSWENRDVLFKQIYGNKSKTGQVGVF